MKKLILVGFGLVAMIALADGSEINGWVVAMSVESRPANELLGKYSGVPVIEETLEALCNKTD